MAAKHPNLIKLYFRAAHRDANKDGVFNGEVFEVWKRMLIQRLDKKDGSGWTDGDERLWNAYFLHFERGLPASKVMEELVNPESPFYVDPKNDPEFDKWLKDKIEGGDFS